MNPNDVMVQCALGYQPPSKTPPPPISCQGPSYLLKVTKFLGKISQFEFLAMTEKNIFAYNLFCH